MAPGLKRGVVMEWDIRSDGVASVAQGVDRASTRVKAGRWLERGAMSNGPVRLGGVLTPGGFWVGWGWTGVSRGSERGPFPVCDR